MKKYKLLLLALFSFAVVGGSVAVFADCYGGPVHWAESSTCDGDSGGCITNKRPCPPAN